MKRLLLNIVSTVSILVLVALVLTACGSTVDSAPAPAPSPAPAPAPAPAPEPEPEPAPTPPPSRPAEPFTYGDDPYLDSLWDDCAYGDYYACDTLFWESPLDSEYETYGLDRKYEIGEPNDDQYSEDIQRESLALVWNTMTNAERSDICLGTSLFGYDGTAEMIVDGADGTFDLGIVEDFLREVC